MQEQNPTVFTKWGSYDGRKNLYSPIKYSFGDQAEFEIDDPDRRVPWRVPIQWVGIINPWHTARYIEGRASHNDSVLGTLNAFNVAIRTQPIERYQFNARSFFTRAEFKDMGRSNELLRGYFQSIRPAIGMMVVNVDIRSAALYKSGPLIMLCLEYMEKSPEGDPVQFLGANRLDQQTRRDLLKFIRNLKVHITGDGQPRVKTIKDISEKGADTLSFPLLSGGTITIHALFRRKTGRTLRYPSVVCVQLAKLDWVPLELCEVVPDQFYSKTLTPDQTKHMIEFSTLKPSVRLQSIRDGLQVLGYGNSKYLQDLGINVDPNLITVKGHVLPTPILMCGQNVTFQPRDGRWNMKNKTLYRPAKILGCAITIYDQRFGPTHEQHLKESLFNVAQTLGIRSMPPDPPVLRKNATGSAYWKHLKEVAAVHESLKGVSPNLIIVVLPEMGDDIYVRVKNAGNFKIGVATQCLRAAKCIKGNEQYFANVCLKINAKLGGINVIPKLDTVPFLTDRAAPAIVIGAGRRLRRSKYVATSMPQPFRTEMIEGLADMIVHVIKKYMQYRKDVERQANIAPQRILFYRDGLSEGRFKECKDFEVPQIFKACDRIGIPRPRLTFVIVTKRHHIRFFPSPGGKSDKSGNAPAGLVVDRGITSPVEYDFYLQSHSGVQGTNRSAHYNVLVDQNNFMPDDLHSISFALCHIYARSTCSVSVVPPVYYADIVCARARQHYDPDSGFEYEADFGTGLPGYTAFIDRFEACRHAFQSVHGHIGQDMYFL